MRPSAFALPFYALMLEPRVAHQAASTAGGYVTRAAGRIRGRTWVSLGLGFAPSLAAFFLYNQIRFGTPLESGYALATLPPFLERQREIGLFSIAHIPMNLDYFLLHLPQLISVPPFFRPDGLGMSVLITSPGLLFATQADWRRPRAWWLLGAAVAVLIPTLLYYGGGWLQYGYRYFLDSVPFVMALCGLAAVYRGGVSTGWKVLIGFGNWSAPRACTGPITCDGRWPPGRPGVIDIVATRAGRFAVAADRLGWVALVLAIVLCAFVTINTMMVFAPVGRTFADWLTYVHAVERVLAGAPLYPPEQSSGPYVLPTVTLFGYAYPPSSVPLFIPFMSYPLGLVAWLTLNVGLLMTGLYAVLGRELGRVRPLGFAFVCWDWHCFADRDGVAFGNASVGLAGLLAWCWVIGRGRTSIGVHGGVGARSNWFPARRLLGDQGNFPRVLLLGVGVACS